MGTVTKANVKIEFDSSEKCDNEDDSIFQQVEETAQLEFSSEMFFDTPTVIKVETSDKQCERNENLNNITTIKHPNANIRNTTKLTKNVKKGDSRCLICGSFKAMDQFTRKNWVETEKWRSDCAETICDLFLNSKSHHLSKFFEIATYCSPCQKTIWDADFTRRQIISLQNAIKWLSIILRRKFAHNFSRLGKSQRLRSAIDMKNISISSTSDLPSNFSFDDVVRSVYNENSSAFDLKSLRRGSKPTNNRNVMKDEVRNPKKRGRPRKNSMKYQHSKNTNTHLSKQKISKTIQTISDSNSGFNPTTLGNVINTEIIKENTGADNKDSDTDNYNSEIDEQEFPTEPLDIFSDEEAVLNAEIVQQSKPAMAKINLDTRFLSDAGDDIILDKKQKKKVRINRKQSLAEEKDKVPKTRKNAKNLERLVKKIRRSFPCPEENCNMKYCKNSRLQHHIKTFHQGMKIDAVLFPCPVDGCTMEYTRKITLKHHIKTVHEGIKDVHSCEFCPKTFHSRATLRRHKFSHPESNGTVDDPKYFKPIYEFTCTVCDQGYHKEEDLLAHREVHSGSNPFVCSHCKKHFTNRTELIAHIRIEHDHETPTCEFCGKSFISSRTLQHHRKIHLHPEECFKCSECVYIGINEKMLSQHMKQRHGEAKTVQCETCGKTLKHQRYLLQHMQTHQEKRHKCHICEKTFSTWGGRKRHEEIHSGIRRHVCTFCGKALTTADNLKAHELIHTRDPNVPLRKRIYKKPFPKKKKKVTSVLEVDTVSNSSQSQNNEPPLARVSNNSSFSIVPNVSQNNDFYTHTTMSDNLTKQPPFNNCERIAQSKIQQHSPKNHFPFPSPTFPFVYNLQNIAHQ